MPSAAGPAQLDQRNTTLDAVRGIAVLGILTMNVVSYGLAPAAYFNLDAGGMQTTLDWVIGGVGEIFFDQKFMGLFSALFGAGIVIFADRAEANGRRPVALSLWRNALLLGIGVVHSLVWEGDILLVYAACAPVVIVVRKAPVTILAIAGALLVLSTVILAVLAQTSVDATTGAGAGGGYWSDTASQSDAVGLWLLSDFVLRSLGMMLIGVALCRAGIITGDRSDAYYARMARWGLGTGLPLSALGLWWLAVEGFSPKVAVVGSTANTVATIPVVLGYLAVIARWNSRGDQGLRTSVRATGRMALTNYLSQTFLGLIVLGGLTDPADVTRTDLALFVLAVWALQLTWSPWWLRRFRFGPVEWLWRCGTYRRWQPMRRSNLGPARPGPR